MCIVYHGMTGIVLTCQAVKLERLYGSRGWAALGVAVPNLEFPPGQDFVEGTFVAADTGGVAITHIWRQIDGWKYFFHVVVVHQIHGVGGATGHLGEQDCQS